MRVRVTGDGHGSVGPDAGRPAVQRSAECRPRRVRLRSGGPGQPTLGESNSYGPARGGGDLGAGQRRAVQLDHERTGIQLADRWPIGQDGVPFHGRFVIAQHVAIAFLIKLRSPWSMTSR